MKPTSNTLLIMLAAAVIGAGAYWYFFMGTSEEATLSTPVSMSEAQGQFQMLISQLSPISFPTEIFSDPRFGMLVDLTMPVTPEPVGRPDPFAQFQ